MEPCLNDIFDKICDGQEVKQNLALLRSQLKKSKRGNPEWESLLCHIKEHKSVPEQLLLDDDAKVRKNTALLIEDLALSEYAGALFKAYRSEEQYYVRTGMLEALTGLDYVPVIDDIITCRDKCISLLHEKSEDDVIDNSGHVAEELSILSGMLKRHGYEIRKFTGFNVLSELILVTNRNQKAAVLNSLGQTLRKEVNAGVMVKSAELRRIFSLRTVQEFLFVLNEAALYEDEPIKVAEGLLDNGLLEFLDKRHEGKGSYLFRVEAKYPESVKPVYVQGFIRKFSSELMKKSDYRLLNSTTDYDIELRIIKRSNGKLAVLLKLYTVPDNRFRYRKNVNAVSMRPANAALAAEIAKPYLMTDTVRLDLCCGVGTLLIESCIAVPAKIVYGIDIVGETIVKAEQNWALSGLKNESHFIMKDFRLFSHEHLFDEIITEPPALRGKYDADELDNLYIALFDKAAKLLKPGGIFVIWSHNRKICRRLAVKPPFSLIKECEISMVDGTDLFIIKKK